MAYKIQFDEHLTTELHQRLSKQRDRKIYRRLLCLDWLRQGYSRQQIGAILQVSSYSVTQWIKRFIEGGLDRLCQLDYDGRRVSKLQPHRDAIKQQIQEDSVKTLVQLQHWLTEELGVFVEQSWLSRWLKKNSIALTKRLD